MNRFVILILLTVACGGDAARRESRGDPPARTRSGATSQAAPALDANAFVGSTQRVEVRSEGGGVAVLDAVRTARHEAFERVVLEFRGDTMPGYAVEYATAQPTQCGSGEAMQVRGRAHLLVRTSPAQAHAPVGDDERSTIPKRSIAVNQPVIEALEAACDFEAVLEWVIGVDARRPFRVTTLRAPARIVIDVSSR